MSNKFANPHLNFANAHFKKVFNMRWDDPSLCDWKIKMLKSSKYNLDDFVDLNDEEKDMMNKTNAKIDKRVEELKNKKKLNELKNKEVEDKMKVSPGWLEAERQHQKNKNEIKLRGLNVMFNKDEKDSDNE